MMDDFETAEIQTGETSIFARWSGSRPPILLLHGFPQTHLMWRSVAPMLARHFTVVCPDLRGYGRSGCPASTPDHAPYAKRAMAQDLVHVMAQLGFARILVRAVTAETVVRKNGPDIAVVSDRGSRSIRECPERHRGDNRK